MLELIVLSTATVGYTIICFCGGYVFGLLHNKNELKKKYPKGTVVIVNKEDIEK